MTELFDKNDVITLLTREHVKVGDKGYFGDNLARLATDVEHGEVHVLAKIYDEDFTLYPFKGDHHANCFALFLPADKVKKQLYRPIKNIDELFNFLVPGFVTDDYNTVDKIGIISCTLYELKGKQTGYTHYRKFSRICLTDNSILLDECDLGHFFKNYEIKRDGEFVPFGIKEE